MPSTKKMLAAALLQGLSTGGKTYAGGLEEERKLKLKAAYDKPTSAQEWEYAQKMADPDKEAYTQFRNPWAAGYEQIGSGYKPKPKPKPTPGPGKPDIEEKIVEIENKLRAKSPITQKEKIKLDAYYLKYPNRRKKSGSNFFK